MCLGVMQDSEKIRLDKWLWAARFFKTRSLATDAIKSGKVSVNGARVKPSREVHIGELIKFRQGNFVREVIVINLCQKRGPASEAQKLYEETEESRQNLTIQKELLAQQAIIQPHEKGRPTKKARRMIIQFTHKNKIT